MDNYSTNPRKIHQASDHIENEKGRVRLRKLSKKPKKKHPIRLFFWLVLIAIFPFNLLLFFSPFTERFGCLKEQPLRILSRIAIINFGFNSLDKEVYLPPAKTDVLSRGVKIVSESLGEYVALMEAIEANGGNLRPVEGLVTPIELFGLEDYIMEEKIKVLGTGAESGTVVRFVVTGGMVNVNEALSGTKSLTNHTFDSSGYISGLNHNGEEVVAIKYTGNMCYNSPMPRVIPSFF